MKFLVDRCAGRRLAEWLRGQGHDVQEARSFNPDPGDRALLEAAESEDRVLITMDKDFGELIYLNKVSHAGLIRLPDVRVSRRVELVEELIDQYREALENRAILTVQGGRVRISHPPSS